MKNSHRLDYASLAEILGQRGLVESQRLKLALQSSHTGPIPFPEVLVGENLIGDWDLSRIVCEIYGLPFLPVDLYSPTKDALANLDAELLREHRLIPLTRHKGVVTICMPAMVPADVLGLIASSTEVQILPVVGSVNSNNRWLAEHLAAPQPSLDAGLLSDWNKIFDEGDAAVLLNLEPIEPANLEADLKNPSEAA